MTTSADEPVTEHDDSSGTGAGDVGVSEVIEAEVDEFDGAELDETAVDGAQVDGSDVADASPEDIDTADAGIADAGADVADDSGVAQDEPAPMNARIPPARTASRSRRAATVPDPEDLGSPDAEQDLLDAESDSAPGRFVPSRRGRGGYDPEADAVARAARYRFRQRTTLALALSALLFGGFALVFNPLLWWGCGLSVLVLAGYLFYLRRQVRFEEEIRRRRAARLLRGARPATAEDAVRPAEPDLDRDAARDLRRRAVVMDIDDEDPAFDFLETFDAAAARATRARAGGGEIPRAAGE